ncbi:hypothetical protein EBR66_07490 [bacterium]|nr:hypothetical protein [bacterium]
MDAVICWADTSDTQYITQRNIDLGTEKQEYAKRADAIRVGKRDELRFCIRGLYYNMPWLRNIYLVTWGGQFPAWLDKNDCATRKPPILPIQREKLNGGKYMYGSIAVEACIHTIPNLSDFFIYANSDTFVCKPMAQEQWLENGVGKIIKSSNTFFIDPSLKKAHQHWYKYGTLRQWKLFKQQFPNPTFQPFMEPHQITLFSKQACMDVKHMYPTLYDKTIAMKGRVTEDYIGRLLFAFMAIQKGYSVFNTTPPKMLYYSKDNLYKPIKHIPDLLCTNLNSQMNAKQYNAYMRCMLDIFRRPHPSEIYLSYESTCYYRYKDVNTCRDTPMHDMNLDSIQRIPMKGGTRKKRVSTGRSRKRQSKIY